MSGAAKEATAGENTAPASQPVPQARPFAQARSGKGPPLVLLHGFGGNHTGWIGTVQRLPSGTPTLSYDLPGHDRSIDVPGAGRAPAMAKAILADLDARGVEGFHLAGHSMGGATAVMMALRAPGRVLSLTLLAPGGFGTQIAYPVLLQWARASSATAISRALRRMTAPGHETGAFEIGRVEAMRRRPGQLAVLDQVVRSIVDNQGSQGAFDREQLRGLPNCTLVWGVDDPVVSIEHADGMDDAMRVVRLESAGHMLMEERPRDVARIIAETMAGANGDGAERCAT